MAFVTATTNQGASNASASITYPSPIQANDILMILLSRDGTSGVIPFAGFTTLATLDMTLDGQELVIFWKRATGSENGTITAGAASAGDWAIAMGQWRGRDTTNPPVAGANTVNNSANASGTINTTAAGVTALVGDDLVYSMTPDPANANSISSSTPPSGFTNKVAFIDSSNGGFSYLEVATDDNVAGGATGTLSASFVSTASGGSGWAAVLIRIPAAGGVADDTAKPAVVAMFTPDLNARAWF